MTFEVARITTTGCWCGWEVTAPNGRQAVALYQAHAAGHEGQPASVTRIKRVRDKDAHCGHCGSRPSDPPFPDDQCPRCEPRL